MPTNEAPPDADALADDLLATSAEHWAAWLSSHAGALSLGLIEALKKRSDQLIKQDPAAAERITRAALAIAKLLPHEPFAMPLARWARGNWAAYNQPDQAVACYSEALISYEAAGHIDAIARISSNLVFANTTLGRFNQAIAAAERADTLLTQLGPAAEHYLVNLAVNHGWLLYEQEHYSEALAVNAAAMLLALRHEMYEEWAELRINQAFTLVIVGQLAESERLLLESRKLVAAKQRHLTVARVDLNLGDLYSATGQLTEALRHFRLALDGFNALDVVMEHAAVLLFEAELLARLGALRAARRAYDHARAQFEQYEMWQYVAQALLAGASVRRIINPADQRIPEMLSRASAMFAQLNLPVRQAEVELEQALLALDQGNQALAESLLQQPPPENAPPALIAQYSLLCGRLALLFHRNDAALTLFNAALATSRAASLIWLERAAHARLGDYLVASDQANAKIHLEAAAQIDETMRAGLRVEELTASFQSRRGDVLPLLIGLAVAAAQPLDALRYAWRWNGGALFDLMAVHASNLHVASADHAELATISQQLAILRWQLAHATQEQQSEATLKSLRARYHVLEQHMLDRRRYLRQGPTGAAFAIPAEPYAVLARLDADRLIEYVRCGEALLAICADRDGNCHTTWLGPIDRVYDLLGRFEVKCLRALALHAAKHNQQLPGLIRDVQLILEQLYAILIAPLPELPTTGRLLLAACAPLHLVPFAALWDGAHYLVERYELEQIPSGALLAAPAPAIGTIGPALVIGASAEAALGAVQQEVAAVAAALPGCTTYLDDPAALAYLIAMKQAPQILHLSAHTELDAEPTIFSALQLAGAMLTIERCYDLCLAGTELVALSGCTTAAGMESGGALLAFQSALLVAGAKRILASLWQVNDEWSAALMATFYRYLMSGSSAAAALRATQLDLLRELPTAHPVTWAAFTIIRR